MDVKEKLIELLADLYSCDPAYYDVDARDIAQHLVDHAVAFQKWISVDDRLPEFCIPVLARCFHHGKWRTLVCHTSEENAGEWYTDEVCQWVKVTHWMPLPPELPKEEADDDKTD